MQKGKFGTAMLYLYLAILLLDVLVLSFAPMVGHFFPRFDRMCMWVWFAAMFSGLLFFLARLLRTLWRCRNCLIGNL